MAPRPVCLKLVTRAAKGLSCALTELVGTAAPIVAIGALGLLTVTVSNRAQAATSLQTFTTTDTFTAFPTASASSATYYSPLPQFTVQPFNAHLGTLTSTLVTWSTTASFTGTVGSASGGGSASFSFGGQYEVDGIAYAGNGTGNGNGTSAGNTFSVNVGPYGNSNLFPTTNAGVTYNPLILADFQGANPFSIAHLNSTNPGNTPYRFTYNNINSGSASFTSTASVTYDYVAAPSIATAPGPLPLLGAGAAWGWSRQLRRRCAQRQG